MRWQRAAAAGAHPFNGESRLSGKAALGAREVERCPGTGKHRCSSKNYNNECLNQLSRANFAFATTSHVNMEVALYKVEEWEPVGRLGGTGEAAREAPRRVCW